MQVGDAYLIVYSITDRASFEKASELRIQLRRARQTEDIPIILVGNKSDLVRCREVSVSGEVLGTTLAPHTLACRQVPFPSPLQGCNQGLSGVLRGVSCLRHPRFPSFVLVSVSHSPFLVFLQGSRLSPLPFGSSSGVTLGKRASSGMYWQS